MDIPQVGRQFVVCHNVRVTLDMNECISNVSKTVRYMYMYITVFNISLHPPFSNYPFTYLLAIPVLL